MTGYLILIGIVLILFTVLYFVNRSRKAEKSAKQSALDEVARLGTRNRLIKENIEKITDYNSADKEIKQDMDRRIENLRQSRTEEHVKIEVEKFRSRINSAISGL